MPVSDVICADFYMHIFLIVEQVSRIKLIAICTRTTNAFNLNNGWNTDILATST